MADEPEVKPGETVGDELNGSAAPGETVPGEQDAKARETAEREAFLAQVVESVVSRLRAEVAPAPSNPPPTPANGPLADLEREAAAIEAEAQALAQQFQRDGGWTADTLVRRQDLTDRRSAWRAEAAIRAVRMNEQRVAVEKAGSEAEWLKWYEANKHRGDVDVLRAAWERDNPRKPAETKPQPKFTERPPAPDVSGAAEVTAQERKARTMTQEQVRAAKAKMDEAGDYKGIRELDAKLRNGEVLLKG